MQGMIRENQQKWAASVPRVDIRGNWRIENGVWRGVVIVKAFMLLLLLLRGGRRIVMMSKGKMLMVESGVE